MLFTDPLFLVLLCVALFVANYVLRAHPTTRIAFLTVISYAFYATNNWRFAAILLLSTVINYYLGLQIGKLRSKSYLLVSILFNLGILIYAKYVNFFIQNYNAVAGTQYSALSVLLPIGVSFFTFEAISYTVDIYRKEIKPEQNLLHFAFFMVFFPRVIAGPIVRAAEFLPQLKSTPRAKLSEGVQIFVQGLIKKLVIADTLAIFVDLVFAHPNLYATSTIWLAVIAYAIQIFCDFSGYTDMAIGLAIMFGYSLPKNFDMPYLATSVTEFWRRWHMTLSRWIRDYIYISLGGNRKGKVRQYANLLATMLLGGLWHGASWTFVMWGGMHGAMLGLEKACGKYLEWKNTFLVALRWCITMLFVLVAWVFFRAGSFSTAWYMLDRMFVHPQTGIYWVFPYVIIYGIVVIIAHIVGRKLTTEYKYVNLQTVLGLTLLFIAILTVLVLAPREAQPFIYFQF